jgi:hypothetical protein
MSLEMLVGGIGSPLKEIPLQNPSVPKSADFGGDQKCLSTSRKCAAEQKCAKKFSTVLVKPDRVGVLQQNQFFKS